MSKTCPYCASEIADDAKICPECNESLIRTCPYCGEEINENAIKCKHCGEFLQKNSVSTATTSTSVINNKPMPPELEKYNWGLLLTSWIWGLCNGMPQLHLILLIVGSFIFGLWFPLLPLGYTIWLGTKGNQWAWQHKDWQSIEEFNDYQRKWVKIPLIIYGIIIAITIFFVIFLAIIAAIAE